MYLLCLHILWQSEHRKTAPQLWWDTISPKIWKIWSRINFQSLYSIFHSISFRRRPTYFPNGNSRNYVSWTTTTKKEKRAVQRTLVNYNIAFWWRYDFKRLLKRLTSWINFWRSLKLFSLLSLVIYLEGRWRK